MKTNKILKDILKENPQLKKNKKNLEKIIDTMVKLNPEVKINKKFKKDLKTKLNTVIDLKNTGKNKTVLYRNIFSVFSLVFVMFGVYYFVNGVTFINNNSSNNIPINNLKTENEIDTEIQTEDELIEEKILENEQVILEKQKQDVNDTVLDETQIQENTVEPTNVNTLKIEESKNNINEDSNNDEGQEEINEEIEINNEIKTNMIQKEETESESNNDSYNNSIEDTQIIDLLGKFENSPEDESVNLDSNARPLGKGSFGTESLMLDSMEDGSVDDSFIEEDGVLEELEKILEFDEVCIDNYGEIIIIQNEKICIVGENVCNESDYKNGICNFLEKK